MARRPSAYVISITPFDDRGALDEPGLRAHLRRMAGCGLGVYVGGAGSGEGYSLRPEEVERVLAVAVDELAGAVPVRAMGVEPRTAAEMVAFAEVAAAAGVDAMQVYSMDLGHLGRPERGEIERYLRTVLDAATIPVVISTHFSVGYFAPADLLAELAAQHPSIVGVNCTNPDLAYLTRLLGSLPDRVEVHTGFTAQALAALSLGASGFLTSEANTVPQFVAAVIERWEAGDLPGVAAVFDRLWRYSTELYAGGGSIRATKEVLRLLGLPGGPPRAPRLPVSDPAETARLEALVAAFGLLETAPGA